jgi:hypothetical protein
MQKSRAASMSVRYFLDTSSGKLYLFMIAQPWCVEGAFLGFLWVGMRRYFLDSA